METLLVFLGVLIITEHIITLVELKETQDSIDEVRKYLEELSE